ncbi:MAG TPA: low molecular weight protein-tyrosine-phosphatase [Pseudomonadales bacterium]
MSTPDQIGVLFVCLGNICRSPSAQGIFQHHVEQAGLAGQFRVDSCGTAPFNVGKQPDQRTLAATRRYGYDISDQIARQICDDDYRHFDYIIPMDRKNMMSVTAWQPKDYHGEIRLLMEYHPDNLGNTQIPDPYHEGIEQFYPIIETIEQATAGLLQHIIRVRALR